MRRSASMYVQGNPDLLREIHQKVKNDAEKSEVIASLYIVIYQDTEGFRILMEEIKKHNLSYTFFEGRRYTKEEYKAAEFFELDIIYPWEMDGTDASEFGMQYAMDCQCKCGRRQISELRIDKRRAKKYDICTIQPEIIINDRLRNLILKHNLTGCEFGSVVDYKGRLNELELYQLKPTHILPQMSDKIRVHVDEYALCKQCNRNGTTLISEIIYEKEKLQNTCDFNLTQEYMGVNLYCKRILIVNAKVYDLFQKNRIKRCVFEPVSII